MWLVPPRQRLRMQRGPTAMTSRHTFAASPARPGAAGIIEGAKDGKGRGRQVISTARTCDVILIVLDAAKPMTHKRIIERELEGFGIRLNKTPPNIAVVKRDKGGLVYRTSHTQAHLSEDLVRTICTEYKWHHAEVTLRQPDVTVDEIIDAIEGNRTYIREWHAGHSREGCCLRMCGQMRDCVRVRGRACACVCSDVVRVEQDRLYHNRGAGPPR